jgi:DHA1 family bicyclomycin/chloramphenicol resistance-like MFS transporter
VDASTPKTEVAKTEAAGDQRPAPVGLIVLLMAMSAIGPVSLNILVPATPAMAVLFDTSIATVQLTLSLYLFGLAISQLFLGPLSDRFGRKPVLLAGLGITALASFGAMFATSIGMLILFRTLQALGASSGLVIGRAVIRDLYSRERSAAMIGLVTTVMVVAPMLAPMIGGIIDTHFGWEYTFALVGLVAAIVMGWSILSLPETRPDHVTGGGMRYIMGETRELLSDRRFLGYVLVCALGTSSYFAFLGAGPHIVVSMMARTSAEYGLWFMVSAGSFMVGNFITTRTVQRYGVDRMIAVGLVFQMVGAVATIATVWLFPDGGPWTIFLPQIAMSVGNGIFLPNCVAGAVSVRPQAAGTASGLTGFMQMSIGATAAQVMSHLVATAPTAMPLAIVMAIVSVAATVAFYVLLRRRS